MESGKGKRARERGRERDRQTERQRARARQTDRRTNKTYREIERRERDEVQEIIVINCFLM